jgi:hypothetical protein
MSVYMTQNEQDRETSSCAFIDNIVYGAYNEQGEISMKGEEFDMNDWKNPAQYKKINMPASQAIGVASSLLLVIALAATAIFTRRSLVRQTDPWSIKRRHVDPDLLRENSSVDVERSRREPGVAII